MEKSRGKKSFKAKLQPLDKQLDESRFAKQKKKRVTNKSGSGKGAAARDEDDEVVKIDAKSSARILAAAREQLEEEELRGGSEEERNALQRADIDTGRRSVVDVLRGRDEHADFGDDAMGDDDDDNDDDNDDELDNDDDAGPEDVYEELEIDEADEALVASLMKPQPGSRNLADIVMAKIREAEARSGQGPMGKPTAEVVERRFNPKIVKVYRTVGEVLAAYRSGKLPKPFKIIPGLVEWEEILFLTSPENWSPAATFQATRIFASSLNAVTARRFYQLVLLPNIRQDIATNSKRKLNSHLFKALVKSVYKPSAFFRGILLPLAEGGDCTLREASVLAAVITRMSIPAVHSSAAILKLCQMNWYQGPTSLFLRVLLNKRYALSFRVIDAVVNHFLSFLSEHRQLPVLWHQCLLTFVQRYKKDITVEQKQAFKPLLKKHFHRLITPEIRRELYTTVSRDQKDKAIMGEDDMDEREDGDEDDDVDEDGDVKMK